MGEKTFAFEFEEILSSFFVKMRNIGHSQYRCATKINSINNAPVNIYHGFPNSDSEHRPTNGIFETLKTSKPFLGPYTMWLVQLNHLYGDKRRFDDLKQFIYHVTIELHGNGTMIPVDEGVCDQDLEQYYYSP